MKRPRLLFNHLRRPLRPQSVMPTKRQRELKSKDSGELDKRLYGDAGSKKDTKPKNPNGTIAGLVALLIGASALVYHLAYASE